MPKMPPKLPKMRKQTAAMTSTGSHRLKTGSGAAMVSSIKGLSR
jgi:hypothetical protein